MKTLFHRSMLAIVAGLALTSAALAQANRPTPASPESQLSEETHKELARARQATVQYHDLAVAENDKYDDLHLFVSGQGFHFLNWSLLNGTFDPEKPQILVYAPTSNGKLRLVAVEYAVPIKDSPDAPQGFTGENDVWEKLPDALGGVWVLHAWVWQANPKGIFAEVNPNVP